jgi:hypothetical protein
MTSATDVVLAECADEAELDRVYARLPGHPGPPVLPFRHRRTGVALRESAAFLGVVARSVPGAELLRTWRDEPLPVSGTGAAGVAGRSVVVALSPDAVTAATRFGSLTGRPVVTTGPAGLAGTFAELAAARSLVIVPPAGWTSADLAALRDARRAAGCPAPVGFLYPFGAAERELFALKVVLFGRFFTGGGRYRFLYPIEARAASIAVGDADVVVGPGRSAAATDELLRSDGDFLYAAPHSNGVNMGLGSVVLCARRDRPDGAAPARSLPCFSGAPCTRQRPANLLLAPSCVRSAVVFLYTCWGALLDDAAYDPATSLAARFAASPYAAALLTTSGLSLLDRAGGPFVADRLRAGVALGAAAVEFNRLHFQRYDDTEDITVLFGDPELTLGAGGGPLTGQLVVHPEFAAFAEATGFRGYPASAPDRDQDRAAAADHPAYFALDYARCVVAGSRGLRLAALTAAADRLAVRADELWPVMLTADARAAQARMAGAPASLSAGREQRIGRLQEAWLGYFRTMVGTLGGFLRLQTDRYFRPAGGAPRVPCPYCGGPARAITLRLAGATGGSRLLIECVACATVLDALPPVLAGVLHGPDRAAAGSRLTLRPVIGLAPDAGADGAVIAALGILEPFTKGVAEPAESGPLRHRVTGSQAQVELPPMSIPIPRDTVPGVYFVDAIVLVGAAPAVLRRSVVVTTSSRQAQ